MCLIYRHPLPFISLYHFSDCVCALSADVQLHVEHPRVKEEQEQLWSSQEGEQFEEAAAWDSVDDEEKSQPSLLHLRQTEEETKEKETPVSSSAQKMQTETDGEYCGGSQAAWDFDSDALLPPANYTADVCEQADSIDDNWKQKRESQSDFKTQENTDTDKKVPSCSDCGKTFDHEDWVQSYIKNSSGELLCSICVHTATQISHLVTQNETLSGKTIFICSVCNMQFSSRPDTVRHVRSHTGEKPFGCSICGQSFSQSTCLGAHMRIHTGEMPFSCSFCQKRFMRSGILARHMRVHTGEKPYTCNVCNTSFTLSQSLSKHMRIHTGEKPFSCSVCGKKFTQKGHLTQHMPLHTGERLFSCHICGKKFTRRSRLKTHKCVTGSSSSM